MPNEFFSKTGHVGITSNMKYSNYSLYQISAKTDNFEFLDQINPKMLFSIKNNENHHQILHIRIGVGSKFPVEQTKSYFQTKAEKMNIATEFFIFKLV